MANGTARRRVSRVVLAGGLLALAASFMPAQALPAPVMKYSDVRCVGGASNPTCTGVQGWLGSDRVVSATFSQVLNPTAGTGATVVIKDRDGATVSLDKVTVSNYTITAFIAQNGTTSTGAKRFLHVEKGPFTATWTAVSNTPGTPVGTITQTFNLDGIAPSVVLNSPKEMAHTQRIGPTGNIGAPPVEMNITIQEQNLVVLGPQELLILDGKASDYVDANGDEANTSGILRVDAYFTDATAFDTTGSSAESLAKLTNTCSGTQCPASLTFSDADDASWDISADVPPGVWSMVVIATDLSGLRGYSKPLTIVKLS